MKKKLLKMIIKLHIFQIRNFDGEIKSVQCHHVIIAMKYMLTS